MPEIKLVYKENEYKKSKSEKYTEIKIYLDENGVTNTSLKEPDYDEDGDAVIDYEYTDLKNICKHILSIIGSFINYVKTYHHSYYRIGEITSLKDKLESIENSDKNVSEKYYELERLYIELGEIYNSFKLAYNINKDIIDYKDFNDILILNENKDKKNNVIEVKDYISNKYNIELYPNIIYYKNNLIKNSDLQTTIDKIDKSNFFNALLKSISLDIEYVKKAYEKGKKNLSIRDKYEDEINTKLKNIVSKKFNELYYNINKNIQNYEFRIRLDNDIHVYLKKNGEGLNLDHQSVGFKWFFNLFFNFLYTDILNYGDIVLMDEPDAHLSLPARRDLRKFLKLFARKNGITFIVATHNPSFVDLDHLDEIRIVKHKKDIPGVRIVNEFYTVTNDKDNVDALEDIIESFGVSHRDILLNPDNKVIFVEGITDYNYLTAFKLMRENKENKKLNLVFLPIGGLGETKEDMEEIINKLSYFRNALVLVDSDKSGIEFEKVNQSNNKLKIIKLNDIDNISKEVKNIENLFSANDKEKYFYVVKTKDAKGSSLFKNTISYKKLEEETINNFNAVLDYLIKYTEYQDDKSNKKDKDDNTKKYDNVIITENSKS